MPCDHLGPEDVIAAAEDWLRQRAIPLQRWPGARARHGENTPGGMWASVMIEVECRGSEWVVTRLDRNREPLAGTDCGLKVVV
jgi:hypothetical protein